jgi:hypothetical protein
MSGRLSRITKPADSVLNRRLSHNTHFAFSDLDNIQIADLFSEYLERYPALPAARACHAIAEATCIGTRIT